MHIIKTTAYFSIFAYAFLYNWKLLQLQILFFLGYYLMSFLIERSNPTPIRKKTALATWNSPGDPSVFNNLEVDTEILDNFIKNHKKKNPNHNLTYTHLMLKALAYTIKSIKDLNSTIAFGSYRKIDDVNISCLVDVKGTNLAPMLVRKVNRLDVGQIQQQIKDKIKHLKTKRDKDFNHQMGVVNSLHSSLVSVVISISSFISYYLGFEIKPLKIKKYGFGTAILTNCTDMEIYNSFAPLVPFTKAMCVAVLCKPKMRAVVDENGQIVAKNIMNINVTFDHRYADGYQASLMIKNMYHFINNMDTLAYESLE
jgi:pyruvate dehydrogenase E2 component (dihydrolipoamide acetyltransferase)